MPLRQQVVHAVQAFRVLRLLQHERPFAVELVRHQLGQARPDRDRVQLRRIQVLEDGFTAEYGDEFIAIGPELEPGECSLVWDVLDMFSVLEASVARLNPDELTALGEGADHRLSFRGFDGNDARESRLLSYTKYLIGNGKWTNLADHLNPEQEGGNSHMPVLKTYQWMPRAFQPIWKSKMGRGGGRDAYKLSIDELSHVMEARRYSSGTEQSQADRS